MKYLGVPDKSSTASATKETKVGKTLDIPLIIVEPGEIKTRMKDIGGYDEAKLEIIEFINFINHKNVYVKLGARLPKGALLYGPPGTGKTLLAKATAGEGNIPFLSCQCASLIVADDGPKKLRKIFKVARQLSPCILFFDEIDCIGRQRNHWRSTPQTQSLTEELLVQLDGFDKQANKMVVVFGATNADDMMDPALLRPGRFDRKIEIPLPDIEARIAIANVHLIPLKTSLKKEDLASRIGLLTSELSGAQIASICNESAMIAARNLAEEITMEHVDKALDRIRFGVKKHKPFTEKDEKIAAYHEAGHAVVGWSLLTNPVARLSILPDAQGTFVCCMTHFDDNLGLKNKRETIDLIILLLAGLAAEEVVFGDYSGTGASDLEKASLAILNMAASNGQMETLGKVFAKPAFMSQYPYQYAKQKSYKCGDTILATSFEEMKTLISKTYEMAKSVCLKNREKLDKIATFLLKKSWMNVDDIESVLGAHDSFNIAKLSGSWTRDQFVLPVSLQNWNIAD